MESDAIATLSAVVYTQRHGQVARTSCVWAPLPLPLLLLVSRLRTPARLGWLSMCPAIASAEALVMLDDDGDCGAESSLTDHDRTQIPQQQRQRRRHVRMTRPQLEARGGYGTRETAGIARCTLCACGMCEFFIKIQVTSKGLTATKGEARSRGRQEGALSFCAASVSASRSHVCLCVCVCVGVDSDNCDDIFCTCSLSKHAHIHIHIHLHPTPHDTHTVLN